MASTFRESNLFSAPIRDLRLAIEDTRLAPIIAQFQDELRAQGITRVVPQFYLSTEWGVPFGTVTIGIPFYLARPELTDLHGEEVGHVEGFNGQDILRYLRHEMGHVINYAYRLYDREEWVRFFGSITQPYLEDYRPQPFSRRFVRHLPGWYAQKHPDEDWAETFAVWMTPNSNWREQYAQLPSALAKLKFVDRVMEELRVSDPSVVETDLDENVNDITFSLQDFYTTQSTPGDFLPGLDGDLRAIFDEAAADAPDIGTDVQPAADLIRSLERQLMGEVFRWTGHFPERTRSLVRQLSKRAEELNQIYKKPGEMEATIAVTILVTSLAMNHVHRGTYFPELPPPNSLTDPEAPPEPTTEPEPGKVNGVAAPQSEIEEK